MKNKIVLAVMVIVLAGFLTYWNMRAGTDYWGYKVNSYNLS